MSGPLLEVIDVEKTYRRPSAGLPFGLPRAGFGRRGSIRAVKGVSFTLERGECLGLVGESGSGKSTLSRCVARLEKVDGGQILFDGVDLAALSRPQLRTFRHRIQLVFQDSAAALDPRLTLASSLDEALRAAGIRSSSERRRRRAELLESVDLGADFETRFPHQLSGGQRQRAAIARSLATEPELLILDEPVSALDAVVRERILELLADLRHRLGLTMLFVGHDLGVVSHIADRVAVMFAGRLVEVGPLAEVFQDPLHPYSRSLLDAVPRLERAPELGSREPSVAPVSDSAVLEAAGDGGGGCDYLARCPRAVQRCAAQRPVLESMSEAGSAPRSDFSGVESCSPPIPPTLSPATPGKTSMASATGGFDGLGMAIGRDLSPRVVACHEARSVEGSATLPNPNRNSLK